ncbi:hypothetical protein [Micromonospora sp. WMMC273]|uniref:hypothetical protein n=1 Tax=Micromonospora sp. WMMC273 TaxID=3015157 RepID=UPI0022B699E5|nr:hypothetical protein [Micromonospora sp. WMMC273]MCZ7478877.1 hypothetical protein [Micromonospora sp. WMMC273]
MLNVDRAQVTRDQDGQVVISDPDCPLLVAVKVGEVTGRRQITELTVQARHPSARISPGVLHRLPLAQIEHLAVVASHPNEAYYRALARPKPTGQRGWDDGHWDRVLAVHQWAEETRRPGGGAAAVAELWGVAVDPTVYRWMATARKRSGGRS